MKGSIRGLIAGFCLFLLAFFIVQIIPTAFSNLTQDEIDFFSIIVIIFGFACLVLGITKKGD